MIMNFSIMYMYRKVHDEKARSISIRCDSYEKSYMKLECCNEKLVICIASQ
jgi:hypothetical protein